jgi:hypothetical protein
MLEILPVCNKGAVKTAFQDAILKVSFKNATTFVAELLFPVVPTKTGKHDSSSCTGYEMTWKTEL